MKYRHCAPLQYRKSHEENPDWSGQFTVNRFVPAGGTRIDSKMMTRFNPEGVAGLLKKWHEDVFEPRRVGCSELGKNYVPFLPKKAAFNL